MSNKKNKKANTNAPHESQEQLQEYFNNPTSGSMQNKNSYQNNKNNKM